MTTHYTADGVEQDEEGWYVPSCACGWKWAPCPDIETAVDVLMEHAYEAGLASAGGAGGETGADE